MSRHPSLDVTSNRRARKYSFGMLLARMLWRPCHPLFRLSPRRLWGWRRLLPRAFGARVGREASSYAIMRIAIPWNLAIGEDAALGALVMTIEKLARVDLKAMGLRGRAWIKEKFSQEEAGIAMLQLYLEMVTDRGSHRERRAA